MPSIDADHRGPIVNLVALITVVVAAIFSIIKIFTKWRLTSRLSLDDFWVALAFLSSIGCTVATGFQVSAGLGQHQNTLPASRVTDLEKALLATNILYVVTIFSVKLSVVRTLRGLTRNGKRRFLIDIFSYLTILWMFVAVITIGFGCDLPSTWNVYSGRCINWAAFWTWNAISDIFGQLFIAVLPSVLLHDVQITPAKRVQATLLYGVVVTTIPIEVLRIISIWNSKSQQDLSWSLLMPTLFTILQANYSVIASCSTFLIPMFQALSVGTISSEIKFLPENLHPSIVRRSDQNFNPLSSSSEQDCSQARNASVSKSRSQSGTTTHNFQRFWTRHHAEAGADSATWLSDVGISRERMAS